MLPAHFKHDRLEFGEFVRTFNLRVGGDDLLNQCRSGTRQPDNKNRIGVRAQVTVLNAYTGDDFTPLLAPQGTFSEGFSLTPFFGWHDPSSPFATDPTFKY